VNLSVILMNLVGMDREA